MDRAPILTRGEVIDRARAARKAALAAAVEELEMALAWAVLHPCPADEVPAHWGQVDLHGEGLVALAGPGAPQVAEFAPLELAAALGTSHDAARQLVADALELGHRLPRLWDLVRAGHVPAWRARLIARETTDLGVQAATFADRLIASTPTKVGLVNAARLVAEARWYFDPDRAVAEEEAARARRGVWLRHGPAPATTEVTMTLETPDAQLLDQTVSRIAADLRGLGDTEPLEVRRARAVGILADPQHALDLMSGREDAAPTPHLGGSVNLYVHLRPEDLAAQTGAVSIERSAPPPPACWASGWPDTPPAASRSSYDQSSTPQTPARTPARTTAPSTDTTTPAMREQVILRDGHGVPGLPTRFPRLRPRPHRALPATRPRRTTRQDASGEPGPALCRTHHRAKTHTAWTYQRRHDGTLIWTSPTGHTYPVTRTSRVPLARC